MVDGVAYPNPMVVAERSGHVDGGGGMLSAANMGPDTNTGHFSIVVAPAPHLDGHYTIFGEVVNGHDVMWAINALANSKKDTAPTYSAAIVGAGQLGWMDGSGGWVTERPV